MRVSASSQSVFAVPMSVELRRRQVAGRDLLLDEGAVLVAGRGSRDACAGVDAATYEVVLERRAAARARFVWISTTPLAPRLP